MRRRRRRRRRKSVVFVGADIYVEGVSLVHIVAVIDAG